MWPLLWALLPLARPAAGSGSFGGSATSCLVEAPGAAGARYLSFLGRRGGALALWQGAWDGGGRLLACAVHRQPRLTRRYRAACAEHPPGPGSLFARSWSPAGRRALRSLARQREACGGDPPRGAGGRRVRSAPPGGRAAGSREQPGRKRRRRGWTVPGTLWCGAGDSAGSAAELGIFQGPDLCCQEHDRCAEQLSALEYKYGMRNYRLHTVSHCDCDARFRQCLLDLNDTISNIIGVTFFNLLEVPCFVLEEKEECALWHWWGGCKHYGPVALARLVQQSQYHYGPPPGEPAPPAPHPPGKGRKHSRPGRKHRRKHVKGPGQDNGAQGSENHREAQKPGTTPLPRSLDTLPPAPTEDGMLPPARASPEPGPVPGTGRLPTGGAGAEGAGQPQARDSARPAGPTEQGAMPSPASEPHGTPPLSRQAPARDCGCYRRLDQCEHKIAPHQVKYQLHNPDSRTLFHCNCTRRLARFLRRTKGPNEVEEEVLSDFVSRACFVLEPPAGCATGEKQQPDCSGVGRAVLAPARHLKNTLGWRHQRPAAPVKVKRQEWEAQGGPPRLYDKCLQLAGAARRAAPHAAPH